MVNVWGDSLGAGIVSHYCEGQLENDESSKIEQEELNNIDKIAGIGYNTQSCTRLVRINHGYLAEEFRTETTF